MQSEGREVCLGHKGFLRDERGTLSMARVLTLFCVLRDSALLTLDSLDLLYVPHRWLTYSLPITGLILGWAIGPRLIQYLTPYAEKFHSLVESIVNTIRKRSEDKS